MLKRLRQDKDFRVFTFTVFNAVVAFLATEFSGITGEAQVYVVGLAIPLLNSFTKYINTRFFGDLGVE